MRKGREGFTLMELMIVIAIIMILSGAIVARIGTGGEKAKIAKAKAEMDEIASACRAFYLDTGCWPYESTGGGWIPSGTQPPTKGDDGLIDKINVKQVIAPDGTAKNDAATLDLVKSLWKGPYLDAIEWPVDPWGAFKYLLYWDTPTKRLWLFCCGPNKSWNGGETRPGTDDLYILVHQS